MKLPVSSLKPYDSVQIQYLGAKHDGLGAGITIRRLLQEGIRTLSLDSDSRLGAGQYSPEQTTLQTYSMAQGFCKVVLTLGLNMTARQHIVQ